MNNSEKEIITSTKLTYEHWSDVLNIPYEIMKGDIGLVFPPSVITYTSDGNCEWLSIGFNDDSSERIYREFKKENIFLMDAEEKGRCSERKSAIDRLNTLNPRIIKGIINAIDIKTGKMLADFLNPTAEIKDLYDGRDKK